MRGRSTVVSGACAISLALLASACGSGEPSVREAEKEATSAIPDSTLSVAELKAARDRTIAAGTGIFTATTSTLGTDPEVHLTETGEYDRDRERMRIAVVVDPPLSGAASSDPDEPQLEIIVSGRDMYVRSGEQPQWIKGSLDQLGGATGGLVTGSDVDYYPEAFAVVEGIDSSLNFTGEDTVRDTSVTTYGAPVAFKHALNLLSIGTIAERLSSVSKGQVARVLNTRLDVSFGIDSVGLLRTVEVDLTPGLEALIEVLGETPLPPGAISHYGTYVESIGAPVDITIPTDYAESS